MENQLNSKFVRAKGGVSQTQIIQPTLLPRNPTAPLIQKPVQQKVPLIPIKQAYNLPNARETPLFKQNSDEKAQYSRDATSLIAKLDSLREIKTMDSPRHHQSTYVKPQQSEVMPFQINVGKSQQLQKSAFASCVEPFRIGNTRNSKVVTHSQQLSQTLPPTKNYEAMVETLMKEQSELVNSYDEKLKILELKVQVLSDENTNLMEQNKLLLTQNLELNDEITSNKLLQQMLNNSQQNEEQYRKEIESLNQQLNQKLDEQKQSTKKMDKVIAINQTLEEKINELQLQIKTVQDKNDKESNAYYSQISIQKQTIQELEQKVQTYANGEFLQNKKISDLQTKVNTLESEKTRSVMTSSSSNKINVKDSFEYKQLKLELDSRQVTITEKENQIETLKIKNSMLQQQNSQFPNYQISIKELESKIELLSQEILTLKDTLYQKDQEILHLKDILRQKDSEVLNQKNTLEQKEQELEKTAQQLKQVRREKAKLSMNLMTAGMANLVMISQAQAQQDEVQA